MTQTASFSPVRQPSLDSARTVFFGIPLKARLSGLEWRRTVIDFNRTLASIYNQSNPNFRILVACHDVPALYFPTDDRLEFIGLTSSRPDIEATPKSQMADQARKLRVIAEQFKRLDGRWYMTAHAGDLVSTRLVEFILKTPTPHGYVVRQGYLLDSTSPALRTAGHAELRHNFDQICGSSAALRFHPQEFDASPGGSRSPFDRLIWAVNYRHRRSVSMNANQPLTPFPFPAVAHSMRSTHNSSFSGYLNLPSAQSAAAPQAGAAAVAIRSLMREFALDHPVWNKKPLDASRPLRIQHDVKVSFLVCGAMKSGTTSLARYIQLHSAIGTGRRKELHYFDNDDFFPPKGPDYSLYHMQFVRKPDVGIYGETTPAYMYLPRAMDRIFRYNKSMKIICILRNPVERAFSQYHAMRKEHRENLSFKDALLTEKERHRSAAPRRDREHAYIDRGFYAEQIRHIWRLFPDEQTLFLRTDDLKRDPQSVMNEVFNFLGIEPIDLPYTVMSNEGKYESSLLREERDLLKEIFEHDIRSLERMLGWDCSSWLA